MTIAAERATAATRREARDAAGEAEDLARLAFLDLVRALPQPPGHDERGGAPPMLRSAS
jgi:hypothetical protein